MNVLAPSPCPATPTLVAPAPALILDQAVFKAWLKTARPGSPIEYHRGHLCVDRQPKLNSSDNEARSELHRLASAALRAAERGLVHLVQRRHGPEDFSYLAIKAGRTPRATHTKARLMALNPFEAFADTYTPRPVKARRTRRTGGRGKSATAKRLEERGRLAAHYRREKARRTTEALASPLGKRLTSLLAGFDRLAIDDADAMIARLEAQDWLLRSDEDFRRLALRLIDKRIGRIRRDAGLVELDDPLPGEPMSAFFIVKRLLRVI